MILYRIAPGRFAKDLSGAGAEMFGGRWNPVGVPVLYAANSTALALLETLVNVRQQNLPPHNRVVLEVPDRLLPTVDPVFFRERVKSQAYGKAWAMRGESVGLKVASSVLASSQDAFNVVLNPNHPDFAWVRILDNAPLHIDTRLIA